MDIVSSEYFNYRNKKLFCEDVPAEEIISAAGTPVFVYSKKFFSDRFKEFTNAFKEIDHTVYFACKSNFNINVIKIFSDLGSGIDVNSEGELYRALKAGVDPSKIILSGVGKTAEEIKLAVEKELFVIKAESEEELFLINQIACELNKKAKVSIRINPDVQVMTHPYITTGLTENKFGINAASVINIFGNADEYPNIELTGLDMHIGSQITEVDPFLKAVLKVLDVYNELKKKGISISHFDFGGGFGVKYQNEKIFTMKELADAVVPLLKQFDCKILFEPGRFLTANGGVLLTKVLYTKKGEVKNFIITDAAMNDIIRPSLYGTYHHIQPVEINDSRGEVVADIVGPVCETGDFLGKARELYEINRDEYMAILSAGAYGIVMASNYNARRKPPEVIVDGNKFYIVRSRESFDHLLYDESIIPEL
jgi:diaminopimelate decarboxylase